MTFQLQFRSVKSANIGVSKLSSECCCLQANFIVYDVVVGIKRKKKE